MARLPARFRISIKDNRTGRALKIELVENRDLWQGRRYRLRLNGKEPGESDVTLTDVCCERLQRWPMTAAHRALLERLRTARQPKSSAPVSPIRDAKRCLQTACRRMGIPAFSHHDFRHFFATTCIEAGVDVPTVSRWLGHKDGGALAMRVYGHLRQDHSFEAIRKVLF